MSDETLAAAEKVRRTAIDFQYASFRLSTAPEAEVEHVARVYVKYFERHNRAVTQAKEAFEAPVEPPA